MELYECLDRKKGVRIFDTHDWGGIERRYWPLVRKQLPIVPGTPFLRSMRKGGRSRADDMLAVNAILWRLRTGGTWKNLPPRFGSARTAQRRLEKWSIGDRLDRIWKAYFTQLDVLELERWSACLEAAKLRSRPNWRFYLDRIWELEVAPLLEARRGRVTGRAR